MPARLIFSKACTVEAAEASSPSAEGETFPPAFLFDSFFFAPPSCKEKAAKEFVQFDTLGIFGLQPEAHPMQQYIGCAYRRFY